MDGAVVAQLTSHNRNPDVFTYMLLPFGSEAVRHSVGVCSALSRGIFLNFFMYFIYLRPLISLCQRILESNPGLGRLRHW